MAYELPASARAYYGRHFLEHLLRAAGSEIVEQWPCTYIDAQIDRIISEAGTKVGLEMREIYLRRNHGT
jgi:hypothetical protein